MGWPEAPPRRPSRAMVGNLAPLGLLGPLEIKSTHTCTSFVSHMLF